jgi:hypothetical protein
MRLTAKTAAVALCLYLLTALFASAQAQANRKRPAATKPATTTQVAAAARKKDRPGTRFWARIMDSFRAVHSAEKKPK